MLLRLALKEFDAALAQSDRDLDAFLPVDKLVRARKKVRYDP
jgi:hypothetical protein